MAQPPSWSSQQDYSQYASAHPASPFPAASLDNDFGNLETTLDAVLENLAFLQRDDGYLVNGIVGVDALNQSVLNLIGGWTPRGAWATSTNYSVGDMVTPSGGTISYVCAVANTSGATFAADLALGYWQPVNGAGSAGIAPSDITFSTTDVILGRASAGSGAGEEIACTSAARSILDDASTAAICTTLGLGTGSNPTFNNLTVANLIDSGLTAKGMVWADASKQLASGAATDGQLLVGSTGNVPVVANITGTANRVTVTNGAGSITLSGPQDLGTASSPTFGGITVTGPSGIGIGPVAGSELLVVGSGLTGTTQIGLNAVVVSTTAATVITAGLTAQAQTSDAAYTTGVNVGVFALASVKGAASTITVDVGVFAASRTNGATNVGFFTDQAGGSTNFAVQCTGTAQSYFGGDIITAGGATHGQALSIKHVEVSVNTSAGATVTASNLIPAASLVIGVTARVTTVITGPASWQIGDGTTANKWGNALALTAGTTTSIANFLAAAASPTYYLAATNVVLTAVGGGGAFTGGAVRLTVHYISLTPATS